MKRTGVNNASYNWFRRQEAVLNSIYASKLRELATVSDCEGVILDVWKKR